VTPTYYVYFTSTTIITSAVLFRGFKGTPTSIITVVNGFLTICSGVVLLQLSKSAKDVPDAAVFTGDLDQIHTIAEQPQPETEPKADAIRGAAAIVRRLSSARQKMELEELKRLHDEKMQETLEPVDENGAPKYEWDGIRRRRTGTFSSARTGTLSTHRSIKSPAPTSLAPPTPHPPLGWSHFPTEEELAEADRPITPALSSIVGTIRTKARSVLLPGHPDFRKGADAPKVQSPMHPVQLTSIAVEGPKPGEPEEYRSPLTGGEGSGSTQHVQFADSAGLTPPTLPLNSARRQFSFQNMFRRGQSPGRWDEGSIGHHRQRISSRGYSSPQIRGATEEETLGLVKGDSHTSMPALRGGGAQYDDSDDDDGDYYDVEQREYRDDKEPAAARLYGHSITKGYNTSPPRKAGGGSDEKGPEQEMPEHEKYRQRLRNKRRSESANRNEQEEDKDNDKEKPLPRLPPLPFGGGGNGGGFM
jgi:hypothetical protein